MDDSDGEIRGHVEAAAGDLLDPGVCVRAGCQVFRAQDAFGGGLRVEDHLDGVAVVFPEHCPQCLVARDDVRPCGPQRLWVHGAGEVQCEGHVVGG